MEEDEVSKPQNAIQWPVYELQDVFFTEATFKEFSDNPPYSEMLNMYKGPHSDSNKPQPQGPNPTKEATKGMTGLESPKSGFRFPHYSQLTEGLIKFYLYLNHTYGVQRKRVVNDQEAKEYQQWVNFQKQIAKEQNEFQTFAQQVAMASPEDYAVFLPGSVQYLQKYLEDNKARVLKYPRLYRMNESLSLIADPVLPSDPQLTLFQDPRYQDDIQLLYCKKLENGSEELLCRGDQVVPNAEKETSAIHQGDWDAETDIVVSLKALETLVDNHQLENHPHQWEIPFTVSSSSQSSDGNPKTVVLEDPFACHSYYPYEANHLLANTLLKRHVRRSGRTFMDTPTEARGGMEYFRKHFCVKKSDRYEASLEGNYSVSDKSEMRSTVPDVSGNSTDQGEKFVNSGDTESVCDAGSKTKEECGEIELLDKRVSERADEKSLKSRLDEENIGRGDCKGPVLSRDILEGVEVMESSQSKDTDENVSMDDSSIIQNISNSVGEDASFQDASLKSNLKEAEKDGDSFGEELQSTYHRRMTRGLAKQMEHSEGLCGSEEEAFASPPKVKCEVSSPESGTRRVTRSASKRSPSNEGGPTVKRVTRSGGAALEEVTANVRRRSRRKLNVQEENDESNLESKENTEKSDELELFENSSGKADRESKLESKIAAESVTENDVQNVDNLDTVDGENLANILYKSESSDGELKIDLSEDNSDEKSGRTNLGAKVESKTYLTGVQSAPQTRLRKRKVPLAKDEVKGKNVGEKETANPSALPLLDNILQLQKRFLAKKRENQEDKTESPSSSSSSGLLVDNILQDQKTLLTKMGNVLSSSPSEERLKKEKNAIGKGDNVRERRTNACIWKIGKLKMCVTGDVDGLYWDYNTKRIFPATVWAKMEHQPWFGFEQVSMGETSRLWLKAAVFPQSKVIRGRVHCHSSDITKWEVLGLNNLLGGSQFQPAYTTKVLHNIFTKLLTLDDGSYLLVHHAGDKQAFIYSTVEEEKVQRFIIYDLHAKHLDIKIHHTPPPVVPWAPLDPSLLLPGSCHFLPCIFPPSPYVDQKEYYKVRRFSPMAGVQGKKKKKKNKGKKNKAKKEQLKHEQQSYL